ncbi:MAG: hydrogenase maturation protease [Acidobacteria bacterium]|nr:hydrogenase maturation protease [Acidobacteriota bacterium]
MRLIICIGNPLAEEDAAGSAVHEFLGRQALPTGVELVDGGLRGLDLLGLVEASERVVFVDSVSGWGAPGEVVALDPPQLQEAVARRYEHATGFTYLLRSLPHLVDPPVPFRVIGLEWEAGPEAVEKAARLALEAVVEVGAVGAGR